jgi:hypothetical protein
MPRAFALSVFLIATLPALAQSQPPAENVTVTALQEKQIQDYVQSHAVPSRSLGKIGRWETGICPAATGLKPELVQFVINRIKTVASKVGAPVNQGRYCRHNVEIVFSSNPQSVMNYIRDDREAYLGAHDNSEQAAEMAKVTRPIQSWYATATIDANGEPHSDRPKKGSPECLDPPRCRVWITAEVAKSTGTRLGDGLRTGFMNVIVLADRDKLVDQEIGTLADYIAYLVLAQPRVQDDCTALSSILNIFAPNCPASSPELSAADTAYLTGLYRMTADRMLAGQKDAITFQMKQALGTR